MRENSSLSNTVKKLNRDVAKVTGHHCIALWDYLLTAYFVCFLVSIIRDNCVAIQLYFSN